SRRGARPHRAGEYRTALRPRPAAHSRLHDRSDVSRQRQYRHHVKNPQRPARRIRRFSPVTPRSGEWQEPEDCVIFKKPATRRVSLAATGGGQTATESGPLAHGKWSAAEALAED